MKNSELVPGPIYLLSSCTNRPFSLFQYTLCVYMHVLLSLSKMALLNIGDPDVLFTLLFPFSLFLIFCTLLSSPLFLFLCITQTWCIGGMEYSERG